MTDIAILDTSIAPLRCSFPRVQVRAAKGKCTAADPIWDRLVQPKFKTPVKPAWLTPHGTTKTLEGLGTFLDRIAEINAIARSQRLELPTVTQELLANGVTSTTTTSDDPDDASLESTQHTPFLFSRGDAEETTTLRRIDWEKYVFACGPVHHMFIKAINEDGTITVKSADRRARPEEIQPFIPVLKNIGLTAEQLEEGRARAAHYKGQLVWANMSPAEQADWRAKRGVARNYLDFASNDLHEDWNAEDYEENVVNGAPEELGFHTLADAEGEASGETRQDGTIWLGATYDLPRWARVQPEPNEAYLWPPTPEPFTPIEANDRFVPTPLNIGLEDFEELA